MGSPKRTITALAVSSLVVLALTPPVAVAEQRVLRADKAVARPCHASLLAAGTPGVDTRDGKSTVEGLVQARLRSRESVGGDWDVAVFDKAGGRLVAASSALRSQELAEGTVHKDQVLVVQACRYGGAARTVTLGLDFLAVPPVGLAERAELVRMGGIRRQTKGVQDQLVKTDLNTLLTALSVKIDDHPGRPARTGRPPRLTDAELLTLAVAQALLGIPSEARWLRFVPRHLPGAFPYPPKQSDYNKRLRAAVALLNA